MTSLWKPSIEVDGAFMIMRYINMSYFLIHSAWIDLILPVKTKWKVTLHIDHVCSNEVDIEPLKVSKSKLYFEISQLLSLSSLAPLVKRPKQLSFFPHASVRKTSFRSMNLYLDYLLSWQCEPELKLSRLLIRSLLSTLCNCIIVHKWLGNCLNMYQSIILLLEFITSTKFTFKISTLR